MDKLELEKVVKRNFSRYYDQACELVLAERPQDPARVFYLRPSSFPYCGVRKFLSWPEALEADGLMHMSSEMLFYVMVGHAFHDIFQEVLGKHGQLYGDWKCPKCKNVREFTTYRRCKACNIPARYNEVEVTYKRTLVGHVDGIYFDNQTKTYWVIDYKSTSSQSLWFHKKKPKFPYKNNIQQITTYAPLLEKKYGITISGYMLVYLPRDNPFKAKLVCIKAMTEKAKAKVTDKLLLWTKVHRKVLTLTSVSEFKKVYADKLCADHADYMANYHNDLNPCPFHQDCFTRDKMVVKAKEVLKKCADYIPMISRAPSKIQTAMKLSPDKTTS